MKTTRYQWVKMLTVALLLTGVIATASSKINLLQTEMVFVEIEARDKFDRSRIANLDLSIEAFRENSVWALVNKEDLPAILKSGEKILNVSQISSLDFPAEDTRFHNYKETVDALNFAVSMHADIAKIHTIGKSLEGRDIYAVQINSSFSDLKSGQSNKPGIIFMGTHHAREHVSTEIPIMAIEYLLENRNDEKIAQFIETRDIWFIPMVNPDGVEWDISSGRYKMWRKNRRKNKDGSYGVDLNRNYGYGWGTGGSSKNPRSDIYMGEKPFSEPETQTIKRFVDEHLNANILVSFHTFSELILYPWGGLKDPIANERDRKTHETIARNMAQWNGYKPEQSSDLYIASGDTTDWSYGTHGIISFTFELSPKSMAGGGFYPGAKIIDRVFNDNLRPILYLIDIADDPHQVLGEKRPDRVSLYGTENIDQSWFWNSKPY